MRRAAAKRYFRDFAQSTRGAQVIGVFVTFHYEEDFDRARVEKVAAESRSMFEGMPGLRSKVFTFDEDARRATNFHVWDSEEAARGFFSPDLAERVVGLYGVPPEIEYVEIAEIVDNANA
jgi:heme-degrading monooxygenase HmoA